MSCRNRPGGANSLSAGPAGMFGVNYSTSGSWLPAKLLAAMQQPPPPHRVLQVVCYKGLVAAESRGSS
jgi:hypothetical protein